jgi:uncharacterized protein YdiU (UPF0061 family)
MRQKLGLSENVPHLYASMFETMTKTASDFTNSFRLLAEADPSGKNDDLVRKLVGICAPKAWWLK